MPKALSSSKTARILKGALKEEFPQILKETLQSELDAVIVNSLESSTIWFITVPTVKRPKNAQ